MPVVLKFISRLLTLSVIATFSFPLSLMVFAESHGSIVATASIPFQTSQDEEVDEMKLIVIIEELQLKLESSEMDQRDNAEQELLKLGPVVLDYLEPGAESSSDAATRIARIRNELERIAIAKFTEASTVTLSGNFTIDDALEAITKQTGNAVSTSRVPDEVLEREISLELAEIEFWQAIYTIAKEGYLIVDPYSGDAGELKLTLDRAAYLNAIANRDAADSPHPEPQIRIPRQSVGLFDFSVTRVNATRDFARPTASFHQLTLLVRWEPRLQPLSIDMPFGNVKAYDESGVPVPLTRTEGVFHGSTSAETPELEILIPFELVDRNVKGIQSLETELSVLLPGRQETFRFKKIGRLEAGVEQRKGGAIVTYDGIRKNDDLFGVTVSLSFDESFNALESHRAWAYDNPMFLEDDKGNRIEPITMEGLRQSNEGVTIRYYFLDDPREYNLVYKTIAAIIQHQVPLKLEEIDFP